MAYRELLALIETVPPPAPPRDSVLTLLKTLYVLPSYEPILGTLDDLISSGNLTIIRDDSLRVGLAQYKRDVTSLESAERYAEEYWGSEMVPLFRERLALREIMKPRLGSSRFTTDTDRLLRDPRFENQVVTRWILAGDLIEAAAQVDRSTELVLRRLEADIGR